MTKTRTNVYAGPGRDVALWFALLSPVLGILVGFLSLLLFYR